MDIKTIAVFIDGTPARETRMAYAVNLAARHGAHLIGIFQLPPDLTGHAPSSFIRGQTAIAGLLKQQEAENKTRISEAQTTFEKLAARQDVRCEFRVHTARNHDERRHGSLHADLVVASNPRGFWPEDGSAPDVVQLTTGVPFLLIPALWQRTDPPQRILVGWNASREARRAIGDALPLLAMATSVTVLIVDPPATTLPGEATGVDVAMFLLRHGVRLTIDPVQSHGKSIADVIIEHAVSNEHDLIVLGAYSHARAKEIVLGGVTRSLLTHSPMPLLISH